MRQKCAAGKRLHSNAGEHNRRRERDRDAARQELQLEATDELIRQLTNPVTKPPFLGTGRLERRGLAHQQTRASYVGAHESHDARIEPGVRRRPGSRLRRQLHPVCSEELRASALRHLRYLIRHSLVLGIHGPARHADTVIFFTAPTKSSVLTGLTTQPLAPAFLARAMSDSWASVVRIKT